MPLTKAEIKTLKQAVENHAAENGGCVARITYHKQNQYARAFVAVWLNDRRVHEIRAYHRDRALFTFDENGEVIEHLSY